MSAAGLTNLTKWYGLVTNQDRAEGVQAYMRYHSIMWSLSEEYDVHIERVCAAFVSLSPNSDYMSNLRSLVSVLDGMREGRDITEVQVATYRHCLERAWAYANGHRLFELETKGPKVMSFYHNILDPQDRAWVTVDGHMYALWLDKRLTMKEAAFSSKKTYAEIRDTVIAMADLLGVVPCQLQATLWFARKRILGVKSKANQSDLFRSPDDAHGSALKVSEIKPYPRRTAASIKAMPDLHPTLF